MISGQYPCCGGDLWLPMPDQSGRWGREDCPHCGQGVWIYFSRGQTKAFKEAFFLEHFEVVEAAREIRPRTPHGERLMEAFAARALYVLNGTPMAPELYQLLYPEEVSQG